jgi:hypothetical protein
MGKDHARWSFGSAAAPFSDHRVACAPTFLVESAGES